MNLREVLDYIKDFFVFPEFTRKRRAEEPLDFLSPTKTRKIQHPLRSGYNFKMPHNDVIDLSDDDSPRTKRAYKTPSSNGSHSRVPPVTIIRDDYTEIYSIKRGSETRFQRSSSKPFLGSAKYTSTPEDRPCMNLTKDDDNVVLVKEEKPGSSANPLKNDRNKSPLRDNTFSFVKSSKGGETDLKPCTCSQCLKSLQQNGGSSGRTKENVRPRLRPYKKLLEKTANDSSLYSTPVGKLFNNDTANVSLSRTNKNLALAKEVDNGSKKLPGSGNQKLSAKDKIKKVLDDFENDPVVVKDSDSESDVILKKYGKKTMETDVKGTPCEAVLDFYVSHNKTLFCPEPQIKKVLKISKKCPHLVILAAIHEGKFISKDDLIKYVEIPNLQTAQASLVQTLSRVGSQLSNGPKYFSMPNLSSD